jgi:hypothetical protein
MAFLIQNWYRILSTEYIQNMYRMSPNVSVYSTEQVQNRYRIRRDYVQNMYRICCQATE